MTKKVKIGNKIVGEGEATFIIAEIGSNHNGELKIAKELIEKVSEAGADAVKFQLFTADHLYSKYTPDFEYLKGKSTYDLIKDIETPRKWLSDLASFCKKKKIEFFASAFDYEAVDLLHEYVNVYKIASFEIVDYELIRYIAEKGKPIIFSTGMANLGEIEQAIGVAKFVGNDDLILLHCISLYPAPAEVVNLRAMQTMKSAFSYPTGFSDHTLGIHISLAAVAMGACVIEKHLTLSREMEGPDHSFAIEPSELKEMVRFIRDIDKAKGSGRKTKSEMESIEMYEKARRSIHARIAIPEGTKITRDMLVVKRPGYGIHPQFMDIIIGRKANRQIKPDEWITWDMV